MCDLYSIKYVIILFTEIFMGLIYRVLPPSARGGGGWYIAICISLKSENFKILKPTWLQGSLCEQQGAMEGLGGGGAGSIVGLECLGQAAGGDLEEAGASGIVMGWMWSI